MLISQLGLRFTDQSLDAFEWGVNAMRKHNCCCIGHGIAPVGEAFQVGFGIDDHIQRDAIRDEVNGIEFYHLTLKPVLDEIFRNYIVDSPPEESTRLIFQPSK